MAEDEKSTTVIPRFVGLREMLTLDLTLLHQHYLLPAICAFLIASSTFKCYRD